MAKVLMLNPPFFPKFSRASRSPAVTKSGTIYYPLWLAYATGWLETVGHTVKLVDAPASGRTLEDCVAIVTDFEPDVIVVDSTTPSVKNDVKVGTALKAARPAAFVILVGTHPTAMPGETLEMSSAIDAVARQEYDETIADLCQALESGRPLSEVLGISYRGEAGTIVHNPLRPLMEDLDKIPFASQVYQKHLDIRDYFYSHITNPIISFFTGRGCPYHCTYCVQPQTLFGHRFRHRSPKNVMDEMEYIRNTFPDVKEVLIDDDTLTVDKVFIRELCEEMIRRNNSLPWSCQTRVNLDYDTMVLMKKAGCRLMVAGFESGNQQILNNVKKGTKVETGRLFADDAHRAGILVHGCFMAGNPGETKQTLQETLDFALSLELDTAQFFPLMVYPGTEAYSQLASEGAIITDDFGQWLNDQGGHNTVVSYPHLTADEIVEWCNYARRRFYLRPKYMARKAVQALNSPAEFRRTLRSARVFFKHLILNK